MGLGHEHDDLPEEDQVESLPVKDPEQVKFDGLRRAAGVATRDRKTSYRPAAIGQINGLKNKLGWSADELRALKLSVSDASRLIQRGPRWRQQA